MTLEIHADSCRCEGGSSDGNRHRGREAGGSSEWREIVVTGEDGRAVALLTREDGGSGGDRVLRAILARPALARGAGDRPRLSVTFVLDRPPVPGDPDLRSRIERATVGLELTVAPTASWLEALAREVEARALFPRRATFRMGRLRAPGSIAETTVANGHLTAALSATIDDAQALDLFDALQGRATGLEVSATLGHGATPGPATTLGLVVDLARVHARLAAAAAAEPVFYERDLLNYLALMIQEGTVVQDGPEVDAGLDPEALANASLDPFLRAAGLILERTADDERAAELGRRFRLRAAPCGAATVSVRVTTSLLAGELEWVEVRAGLHDVVGGILARPDADELVHFVAVDPEGRGLSPLPRREFEPPSKDRPARPAALAVHGNRITTLSAAVQPSAAVAAPAHTLLLAHALQPTATLSSAVPTSAADTRRHLPVIEEGSEPPWPDRIDAKRRWYLPELAPVVPARPADPASAQFLFTFRTAGHDLAGRPGLEASVRLALERRVPASVAAELERLGGDVRGEPVPAGSLSVELEVPFRNERGETTVERFRAVTVEDAGRTITATFELLDDWARIAYGALAHAGFQSQPARVSVAYSYEGYAPKAQALAAAVLYGGKQVAAPLELRRGGKGARERGTLDPRTGAVRLADGSELRLPALGRARRSRPRPAPSLHVAAAAAAHASPLSIRPQMTVSPALLQALRRIDYAEVVRLQRSASDVLFPCRDLGGLYLEEREGADGGPERVAIGCRPALELGQTEHRLYEEIDLPSGLQSAGRVYRSLQSPGRFVYVPDSYHITRFGPGDGERAYRPSILLYSTIDIDDLANSRCVIAGTLEAAASEATLARVLDHLRRHEHAAARIELLTEVAGEVAFEWALPSGASDLMRLEVGSVRTPHGFEVSLATDAFGLPQLQEILARSGISGTATLALPDGSRWLTTLRLRLDAIAGPRPGGPLESRLSPGGRLELRNRIESPVLVSDVLLLDGEGAVTATVPAELRLEPDATATLEVGAAPARALPLYAVEATPSSLVEIRSFVEDITITVLLHNRVDLEAHALTRLALEARVQGVEGRERAEFVRGSDVATSVRFLLPLTSYLASPSLELVASLTDAAGVTRQVGPIPWRLGADGYIVSITPDLLGLQ
jgi:hypothetical protein